MICTEDIVEPEFRAISDHLVRLGQVGHAARHILESRFIRLVVGHVLDRRRRPGKLANSFRECTNCHFLGIADVDHLTDGLRLGNELQQRVDDVGHVREGARLRAVPEHGNRLARQRLPARNSG